MIECSQMSWYCVGVGHLHVWTPDTPLVQSVGAT